MTERDMESGFELDLDNRKLILIFVVLIVICGCFFIWGYMAGKRQGMQLSATADMDAAKAVEMESPTAPAAGTDEAIAEIPSMQEDAVQQDLDWYQSVNKEGNETANVQPSRASVPAKKESTASSTTRSSVKPATVTYSVQVGAFKRRPEAENHARNVRAKGFDSRVEPPESAGQLFLVKVGKFDTRAEAVAVQSRLKNNGFSCFVKTN